MKSIRIAAYLSIGFHFIREIIRAIRPLGSDFEAVNVCLSSGEDGSACSIATCASYRLGAEMVAALIESGICCGLAPARKEEPEFLHKIREWGIFLHKVREWGIAIHKGSVLAFQTGQFPGIPAMPNLEAIAVAARKEALTKVGYKVRI